MCRYPTKQLWINFTRYLHIKKHLNQARNLEEGIEDLLRVSIDVFDRNVEILVIHGFLSLNSAKETVGILRKSNPSLLASKNIVISASQYRNAFVNKRQQQLEN